MPTPPPGPPDVNEQRAPIDQWTAFATGLERGYTFDLDNWLNDVDIRQLILRGRADVRLARHGPLRSETRGG